MPIISAYVSARILITSDIPAVKPLSLQHSTIVSLKLARHNPRGSTLSASACVKKYNLPRTTPTRHYVSYNPVEINLLIRPLLCQPGPRPFSAALLTLKERHAETFPFKKLVDIVIRHQRALCHFAKAL